MVRLAYLAALLVTVIFGAWGQDAQTPPAKLETVQDLISQMTPEQKQSFDQASRLFGTQHYADALATFKELMRSLPGDAVLSKFASEAAINIGDDAFALSTLKPIAAAHPDDWQTAALLTRACAETSDTACREAGMAHMLDLQKRGVTPPNMQAYILEQVKSGENTLVIRTSLVPWGHYKVYDQAQVINKQGQMFLRITIESSDFDQVFFAEQHPKEAAAGMRQFSLDAYLETGLNAEGKRTQRHFTYRIFNGQPPYDTVREEFLKIANGKAKWVTSRGLVVP